MFIQHLNDKFFFIALGTIFLTGGLIGYFVNWWLGNFFIIVSSIAMIVIQFWEVP